MTSHLVRVKEDMEREDIGDWEAIAVVETNSKNPNYKVAKEWLEVGERIASVSEGKMA